MKGGMEKIGIWSFIAGLVIAVIAGFVWSNTFAIVLGILGIIVGLINISDREVMMYLLSSIAILIGASSLSSVIGAIGIASDFLTNLLKAIMIFVAPGAVVVAIKGIFEIARSK